MNNGYDDDTWTRTSTSKTREPRELLSQHALWIKVCGIPAALLADPAPLSASLWLILDG